MTATSIIGIDIGGTKCGVSRQGPAGSIERATTFATTGLDETIHRICRAVAKLSPGERPVFGIACGGPLDSRTGLVLSPPNLPGWDEVPICELLTDYFGGRAFLMNDANACALAEWRSGAGRGTRNMVYLTCGTGMGAGLILDGRLYEGTNGNAGEVGHVRLSARGPVGFGKPGSFEGFCSGGGIARAARAAARRGKCGAFGAAAVEAVTARHVARAARAGDEAALRVFAESGRRLGQALAILVDVLNPDMIVLGAVFRRCRDLLEGPMLAELQREALAPALGVCRIVPAELGDDLGHHSALAVAWYWTEGPGAVQ